jgi:pimeloyl-ACP methyl ester carboxylesterase
MPDLSYAPTRRDFLAGSAALGTASLLSADLLAATGAEEIRPFHVNVPQEEITELRRRIAATRWPDRETVADGSQGAQLAKMQALMRYWASDYDWRNAEAKLNSFPQFMTTIDGLDIHFIHARSRHENALPVIMTHGWPGSVFELLKVVGPLADPTAHGGRAEDAFHMVIPSMPGYGFSGHPTEAGWGADRIALTWAELMKRLGYTRYVAQGGDWGSPVTSAMARQAPTGLVGIHINLPATVPPEIVKALADGAVPAGLSEKERAAFDELAAAAKMGDRSYATIMGTKPQTIGYGLTDSPVALAALMLVHPGFGPWWSTVGDSEKSRDEVLDDVTLYWLTKSGASAGRLYWEHSGQSVIFAAAQKTAEIALPVAITVFPGEIYRAPESWARRAYRNLIYFNEVDKGGHFAAWEQPALFSEEIRAAFRSLRQP